MIIGQIKDGIVLDHITAGRGMEIYHILHLDELNCTVAMIKNAESVKMGKKDIIKIDGMLEIDLGVLGYIAPGITINYIRDGKISRKVHPHLPETVTDVIRCKNPRCITSTEQELQHVFKLTDRENRVYRCLYCETKAKTEE